MWLVSTADLRLEEVEVGSAGSSPEYAVLSHRWTTDEFLFDDAVSSPRPNKYGLSKVESAAKLARRDGFEWIWIDTCCIDKKSSAELTESINSMYMWYQCAGCCYVYLHDVVRNDGSQPLRDSKWFARGWTLQELLAPEKVAFYDSNWSCLGFKHSLADDISAITGIDRGALTTQDLEPYSVGQKMSWAACRTTTRPEDIAYCLLGIFDVNLTPIYGEGGQKAFIRLQEEIMKHDDDQTIFAWSMRPDQKLTGLLATHPEQFKGCSIEKRSHLGAVRDPFSVTNRGLSVCLEITPWAVGTYLAFIDCRKRQPKGEARLLHFTTTYFPVGIFLFRRYEDDQYSRINLEGQNGLFIDDTCGVLANCRDSRTPRPIKKKLVFVRNHPVPYRVEDLSDSAGHPPSFLIPGDWKSISGVECFRRIGNQAFISPTTPCQLMVLGLPHDKRFEFLALGYDFDFNPICLLQEFEGQDGPLTDPDSLGGSADDRRIIFDQIVRHSRVYKNHKSDKLWCLKGHRSFGLGVVLQRLWDRAVESAIDLRPSRVGADFQTWELLIEHRSVATVEMFVLDPAQ